MSDEREAEKLARHVMVSEYGISATYAKHGVLLPLCRALLQAREALAGNLDQPETPESYDAMLARTTAALAAIDALRKEQDRG